MKDSINVSWNGGMSFESEIDGIKIVVDAKKEVGGEGKGPRPKPLMMMALAGCTGMDVVSILKKMRVEFDDFEVNIEGDITDEHPKQFTRMHVVYSFKGKDLPLEKIRKAVELSQDNYCGVSASYKKAMELTYEIKIN